MNLCLESDGRLGRLEILESSGAHAGVQLGGDDLKELAKALLKVAASLDMESAPEEITQH